MVIIIFLCNYNLYLFLMLILFFRLEVILQYLFAHLLLNDKYIENYKK